MLYMDFKLEDDTLPTYISQIYNSIEESMIGNRHPGYAFVSLETYHTLLSSILRMMTQITIYVYYFITIRIEIII
jgi:hypothetical protein